MWTWFWIWGSEVRVLPESRIFSVMIKSRQITLSGSEHRGYNIKILVTSNGALPSHRTPCGGDHFEHEQDNSAAWRLHSALDWLFKILWQHIYNDEESMTTEVNTFSVPSTRKWFPLILNGVLENVLVCALMSLNFARCYLMFMLHHAVI